MTYIMTDINNDQTLTGLISNYFAECDNLRMLNMQHDSSEIDKNAVRASLAAKKQQVMDHMAANHNTLLGLLLFFAVSK